MAIKYVHRQADVSAGAFPNRSQQAGLMSDSDDDKLKYNPNGTVAEVVDTVRDFTIAGALTLSGAVVSSRLPGVTLAQATGKALLASESGQTFTSAVDAVYTLPLASVGEGVHFYIVTGVASGGTGVNIDTSGADVIIGPGSLTADNFTNTGATDAVGDLMHLVSDGVSTWVAIGVFGTWAAAA